MNLILALLIPVSMHGLYNFSFTSELISSQLAYMLLFVFTIITIMMFKSLKKKQKKGIIFNKKYFTISLYNFVQVSTGILIFYLGLNYLVSITI